MSEADTATCASPEVSHEVGVQEAIDAAGVAHGRAVGSLRFMRLVPIAGGLIGTAVGLMLQPTVQAALFLLNPGLAIVFMQLGTVVTVVLALIGYGLGINQAAKSYHRRYLFGMYERGLPARVTARFRVTEAALEADNGRMTYMVRWPAVAEVVETPDAWAVVADLTTFVIPKKAFDDAGVQRGFIKAILDHLSPAARDRSAEARTFVDAA